MKFLDVGVFSPKIGSPSLDWCEAVRVVERSLIVEHFEDAVDGAAFHRLDSWTSIEDDTMRASPARARFWDAAEAAAAEARLVDVGRSRIMKDRPLPDPPTVSLGYGNAFSFTRREWSEGYASVQAMVQLPIFVDGWTEAWLDDAVDLMVQAAVAIDGWYGWALVHPDVDDIPNRRVYWKPSIPGPAEPEVEGVIGLAPAFLLSPRPLAFMGGFEALAFEAPVFGVTRVPYRDGREGAVVRVGRNAADFRTRIGSAYSFFEPFLVNPA